MNNFKYYAFISYSHRDEKWANWLHRSIETYRPPRKLVGQEALIHRDRPMEIGTM